MPTLAPGPSMFVARLLTLFTLASGLCACQASGGPVALRPQPGAAPWTCVIAMRSGAKWKVCRTGSHVEYERLASPAESRTYQLKL